VLLEDAADAGARRSNGDRFVGRGTGFHDTDPTAAPPWTRPARRSGEPPNVPPTSSPRPRRSSRRPPSWSPTATSGWTATSGSAPSRDVERRSVGRSVEQVTLQVTVSRPSGSRFDPSGPASPRLPTETD
jgi:hypothetical protein